MSDQGGLTLRTHGSYLKLQKDKVIAAQLTLRRLIWRYRPIESAAMLKLTLTQRGDGMPFLTSRILVLVALMGAYSTIGYTAEPRAMSPVQAESLLREPIAGVEGKEIIMSRVSFPPHTELPWHWHPGEEFFYVTEGSVTLRQRGQPDELNVEGDAQKITPKVIHTGRTGELGAELVIFRVHTAGEPERYLVD